MWVVVGALGGAWQRDGMDALDGMSLLIKNFNGEQRRIMAEMHQEIQLLISLFIIAVRAFPFQACCRQSCNHSDLLHTLLAGALVVWATAGFPLGGLVS